MATTAKSTNRQEHHTTTSTRTQKPRQTTTASRTDASQVREGVTKARNGAVAIVRQGAERAVDLPVGRGADDPRPRRGGDRAVDDRVDPRA